MHVCFVVFVLGIQISVLSQEIGFEERLRNDLFCVGCMGRNTLTQSMLIPGLRILE